MIVADCWNHRIVEWKRGDTRGRVLAGGNGEGDRPDQLNLPTDVLVDRESDSLIICDRGNLRVARWSRGSGTRSGETIIDNIACRGLAIDDEGALYVTDTEKHEVRRYRQGETSGTLVAGGNGEGVGLHQLNDPRYVCVDGDHAVYVSDTWNHRVMKWVRGAKEGIVVAGGQGQGEEADAVVSSSRRAGRCGRQRLCGRLRESPRDALVSRGHTGHCRGGCKRAGRRSQSVKWSQWFVLRSTGQSLCR